MEYFLGGKDIHYDILSGRTNNLEFITIATTGDASDFGDLNLKLFQYMANSRASPTRGYNCKWWYKYRKQNN